MTGRFMARYRIRQFLRVLEEFVAPNAIITPDTTALMATEASLRQQIIDRFHELYYRSPTTFGNTFWLGVRALKCPLDLWIYQEILHELRPSVIVESGTAEAGTTLFMASICDLLGHGCVLTIDPFEHPNRPSHPRITYLKGSSTDRAILDAVRAHIGPGDRVLINLDSYHGKAHVLTELRAYADLVTLGSYMIVEDSNINGHPVLPDVGPGPMEAIEVFVRERPDFVVDESREKFLLTFNPRGYLRKINTEN